MTVPSKPSKPSHLHLMSLEKCRSMNNSGLAWITIDPSSRYMSRIFLKQPEFCSAEMTFYDGNEENQVYGLRQLAEGGSVRLSNECYVYRGVIEECLRGRSGKCEAVSESNVASLGIRYFRSSSLRSFSLNAQALSSLTILTRLASLAAPRYARRQLILLLNIPAS